MPDIKTGEFAGEIEDNSQRGVVVANPERLLSDRLDERLTAGIRKRYSEESASGRYLSRLDHFYAQSKALKSAYVALNRSSRSTELLEERLRKRKLLESYADLYAGDLSSVTDANSVETKLSEIYKLKSKAEMEAAVEVFGYFTESMTR